MQIDNLRLDFEKLLKNDIGLGELLSEGERKFIMLSAFIYKAIKQKKDYIFIDEVFAMFKNVEGRFREHLMRQLKHAQSKGVKVILAVQNRDDIPEWINETHIVDFSKQSIHHFPQSEKDLLAFDRLLAPDIYLEKGLKNINKNIVIDELINEMMKSQNDEDMFQKTVGTVLLSNQTKCFLSILRQQFILAKLNLGSISDIERENFEMNWIMTIVRLAKVVGMKTADFLGFINFNYSEYSEFEELNKVFIGRGIYNKVNDFWQQSLLE